jgi:hypothetical protein
LLPGDALLFSRDFRFEFAIGGEASSRFAMCRRAIET